MKFLLPGIITLLITFLPLELRAYEYVIHDLGTLSFQESHPTGINQQNVIVGFVKEGAESKTFLWHPKNGLTLLPHPHYQSPFINNYNQVADIFWRTTSYWLASNTQAKHVYIYENGSTHDLPLPKEWKIEQLENWKAPSIWDNKELGLLAFNDQQQFLITNAKQLDKASRFAIWQENKFHEIDPTILSNAYSMNHQGMILGRRWVKKDNVTIPYLVIYNPSKGTVVDIIKDINIVNRKINDLGQVIIFQALKDSLTTKGLFWDPGKGIIELQDFAPMALNNCGQVIGFKSRKATNEKPIPAIWSEGEFFPITNINGFGGIDSLWSKLTLLTEINDNGYIIGEGLFDEKPHGFVLIPK